MNNIKSFNEYTGIELEQVVYDQELNEGIMGTGLRGRLNRKAAGKVRAELADEIELSKSIMEGIKNGLESLNDNFDAIKEELDKGNEESKGDKQKILDDITKILEDSRKNTWDLNQLIDEGEIDYTGFTANIGIASVAYFGILLTPFRAMVMVHKGYNYFFNIVKNTIRKALVMLQLNFDQFENLIITKSFQSIGYLQDQDTSVKVSEFYGKLQSKLFDEKHGMLTGKKGSNYAREQMQLAKQQIDAMMKADKAKQLSDNAYNCLDQYNNTYTKSLETLRQYSSDDVQKHLDAIKTSMSKLAGQDVDLQTYSELIIAAAEEHAYKVSSSIYNKFAKMTEVFSLPNQQKLIDLIQAATKEKQDNAEKERKEKEESDAAKEAKDKKEKFETEATEIFKSVEGVKIGKLKDDKYNTSEIEAGNWTYDEFKKLDNEKQNTIERWLTIFHPEILEKCDKTLQTALNIPFTDSSYIDSLVDYVGPFIYEKTDESYILNFDEYVFEKKEDEKSKPTTEDIIRKKINKYSDVKTFLSSLFIDKANFDRSDVDKLEFAKSIVSKDPSKSDWIDEIEKKKKSIEKELSSKDKPEKKGKNKYYIDFGEIRDKSHSVVKAMKELYIDDENCAKVALKVIGEKILKDNTFVKNADDIVDKIKEGLSGKKKKVDVSSIIYNLIKKSVDKLKDKRSHDYSDIENEMKQNEEKSEE